MIPSRNWLFIGSYAFRNVWHNIGKDVTKPRVVSEMSMVPFRVPNRPLANFLVAVLCVLGSVVASRGETVRLFPGVRAAGYGYAYSAFANGLEALYWNPAGLITSFRRTYSAAVMQDPAGMHVPLAVGQIGFVSPKRARGVWGAGILGFRDGSRHVLQTAGYARRLHSILKIGAALYHDNLSVTRVENWGVVLGTLMRPAHWIRIGAVWRVDGGRLLRRKVQEGGTPRAADYTLATAIGNLHPAVLMADVDPARRNLALGLGYRLSKFATLRFGFSTSFDKKLGWQAVRRRSRIHMGLSAGEAPRFDYAFVMTSKGTFVHSFGLRIPLGPIIRQIRLKPRMLTLGPSRLVGSYVTYEPPLEERQPEEILVRVDSAGLEGVVRRFRKFLRLEYANSESLRTYNGIETAGNLPRGASIRLPLRGNSWADSTKLARLGSLLDRSLILESAHWPSWQMKAFLSCLQGQSLAAENQIGKARTLNPNSAEVMATLAQLYLEQNHPEKAAEVLEQVALVGNKGQRWAGLGLALELSGRHKEAIRAFQKADSLGFVSPSLLFYWGKACLRLGRLEEGKGKLSLLTREYPEALPALRAKELLKSYSSGGVGNDVVVLKRAVPCSSIARGPLRPLRVGSRFPNTGRVYLYVEVARQSKRRIHIQPAWYRDGELVFKSERGWVTGPSNRTYGYKTMHGQRDEGEWRVELRVKETGQYLGQVTFTVGQ